MPLAPTVRLHLQRETTARQRWACRGPAQPFSSGPHSAHEVTPHSSLRALIRCSPPNNAPCAAVRRVSLFAGVYPCIRACAPPNGYLVDRITPLTVTVQKFDTL
eukprot:6199837-Pleurochrysis_carterae.AAC.2